jgi:TPR repeat protein
VNKPAGDSASEERSTLEDRFFEDLFKDLNSSLGSPSEERSYGADDFLSYDKNDLSEDERDSSWRRDSVSAKEGSSKDFSSQNAESIKPSGTITPFPLMNRAPRNTPVPQQNDDSELMRLDLQRRLSQQTRQQSQDLELSAGQPLPSPIEGPRPSLTSALLPYVAAAFFFALLAGGAVFYFIAVSNPQSEASNVKTITNEKAFGQSGYASAIDSGPAKQSDIQRPASYSAAPLDKTQGVASPAIEKENSRLQPVQKAAKTALPAESQRQSLAAVPVERAAAPDKNAAKDETSQLPSGGEATKDASLNPVSIPPVSIGNQLEGASARAQEPVIAAGQPKLSAPLPTPEFAAKQETLAKAELPPSPKEIEPQPKAQKAAPAPVLSVSPEQEKDMLDRGRDLLKNGDIGGARLLFQYLADHGSASATFVLAQTYDPSVLSRLGVVGLRGDPVQARTLYEKAAQMGNKEALAKLGR